MREARGSRAKRLRSETGVKDLVALVALPCAVLVALLCLVLGTRTAKAQQNDEESALWADDIFYQGAQRSFQARGNVRLSVDSDNGQIVVLTERLDVDDTEGRFRAEGGAFGKGERRWGQGALRFSSGEVLFFRSLETDADLKPLQGEGLGWRRDKHKGGLTAAKFQRRKRKKRNKDDWLFHDVRYTRCPVCADALEKQEDNSKDGGKDGNKDGRALRGQRTFPPLWRLDAKRARLERFDKRGGWFDTSPRLHLYHPRLNLYGVPVFYAPYLSFPRAGARASGLLEPEYGRQSQRGWYVSTPIYWALHRSWDITYAPIFTTTGRDASRFETRAAWSAGGQGTKGAAGQGSERAKKTVSHLFDVKAGWSLPHEPVGSGENAQFFAYGKFAWRAPWGLRADALYHGLGDRRYLYNYGQGAGLLSTSAPSSLTDHARVEHFSRNGYARLTFEEQRELLAQPRRADVRLLPEMTYSTRGLFARSDKGGGSWGIESLWRGTGQEEQQQIGTAIAEQARFRQDIVSAAASVGWRQNLPASFVSQSTIRVASTFWHDSRTGDLVVPSIEGQQSFEGLFAKGFRQGARVFYLRPVVELYATLDERNNALNDGLDTKAAFYDTGARLNESLGDRLAFDSALASGQRLLAAAEIGLKGGRGSAASLFVAPNLLREKGDRLSGRLWTGARATWRERVSFSYDTTWLLPKMQPLSHRAEIGTKSQAFDLSFAYKEFHAFDDPATLYEQDVSVKGALRFRERWHGKVSAGYGFLGESLPIGFSLTYKGSCVTLKFSYDRTIYSDREDSETFGASFSLDFS